MTHSATSEEARHLRTRLQEQIDANKNLSAHILTLNLRIQELEEENQDLRHEILDLNIALDSYEL